MKAIRAARAAARERAWALGGDAAPGADGGLVTAGLDATIVIAHSEKERACPTWKKTFGHHHPMTAWADHGADGTGEPLAIVLRPGNAGPDTAADHIEAARLAVAQLPRRLRRTVLVRAEGQLADLELRHRRRARCEDRIRCANDTGLRNLPLKGFAQNQLWCEILRVFSVAGRLACGGRRLRLRLAERWPWAGEITTAATRLQALPSG